MIKTNGFLLILIFILPLYGFCDGFIFVSGKTPGYIRPHFPLEVKYHHVDVSIDGLHAETNIDQIFYNSSPNRLEGHYIFPVPKGAYIKKFTMFINGKEVAAELLPAKKARKIYLEIVRRQTDPALLEYYNLNIFRARIFPIEPFSEKRVKISYSEVLGKNNGTVSYIYPLNTEKFSSKELKSVKINVSVKSTGRIKNLYSTTHEVKTIRYNKNSASVSYYEKNSKPDRDFKLFYSTDSSKIGLSLLTHKNSFDEGFFFMDITPDFEIDGKDIGKKNVLFVLDVSGSMAGKKLYQAKKSLNYCINKLNSMDSFNIVSFSTESDSLFNGLKKANRSNVTEALNYVRGLKAVGGTNIEEALERSFKSIKEKSSVIFITDGKPTIGKTSEREIVDLLTKKIKKDVKIFTFGIGDGINIRLLDKMTSATGGFRSYVWENEDIEISISDFFSKISYPVLTDISLKSKGVKLHKTHPLRIDDLYRGSSVTLTGKYKNSGNTVIELSGTINGERKTLRFHRSFDERNPKNDFIPSLWAARRVGFLLDQIRLNGESKELKDEIVRIARKYGIITPYTSFLIVEDEEIAVRDRRIKAEEQIIAGMLPKDGHYKKKIKEEYINLKKTSGLKGIRASKEIQDLYKSKNIYDTQKGKNRLGYRKRKGSYTNLTNNVRYINGRAFYLNGKYWIDPRIGEKSKNKKQKIRINSKEYYRLLNEKKGISKLLSLGKNIIFIFDNNLYEIHE